MSRVQYDDIPGWGADLDPANRPAVPMEKEPAGGTGAHWDIPELQEMSVKIFQSVEHARRPPVFGTSVPPRGLSGRIREYAYMFGEGRPMRWLPLLLADRIDVIEGVMDDIRSGHVPNIFAEMGLKAEWKYNRTAVVRNTLIVAAFAAGTYALMSRRRTRLAD